MHITITCPNCGNSYDVPDDRVGLLYRCDCGADILVVSPAKKQAEHSNTHQHPSSDPTPVAPWESSAGTNKSHPRVEPQKPQGSSAQSYYNPRTGELYTPQNKGTSGSRRRGTSDAVESPRPWSLTIMIVITDIFCGIGLYYLALSIVKMAPVIDQVPDEVRYRYLIEVTVAMVIYSVILSTCASLWNGYNWARLAMIVIMSTVFAGSIRALTGPMQQYTGALLVVILMSVSFIALLCTKSCRYYCT
jgi:hypothetical protein